MKKIKKLLSTMIIITIIGSMMGITVANAYETSDFSKITGTFYCLGTPESKPVKLFTHEEFIDFMGDSLAYNAQEQKEFHKSSYDKEFFENKFLYIYPIGIGSSGNIYKILSIYTDQDDYVDVAIVNAKSGYSSDITSWVLVLELDKSFADKDIFVDLKQGQNTVIEIGNATSYTGNEVDIPVTITNANFGYHSEGALAGAQINISYDKSKLIPVSIIKGDVLKNMTLTSNLQSGKEMSDVDYVTAVVSGDILYDDGVLFTVRFRLAENVSDKIVPILFKDILMTDKYLNSIDLIAANGGIEINQSIIGDVNEDGIVNIKDLVLLKQYLSKEKKLTARQMQNSDVNNDSNVNDDDAIRFEQYLAQWPGVVLGNN